MRTVRNLAIIALLAFAVAFLPGGDNAADAALTTLTIAFLAVITWFVYRLYRENQLTYVSLRDDQRAILLAAIGLIALMIAGADELLGSGGGVVAWIALMALAAGAIFWVWREATTLS